MTEIVTLVGNGVSIAYNENLKSGRLAQSLYSDFEANGLGAQLAKLEALGEQLRPPDGPMPSEDFEALLGPIDRLSLVFDSLVKLNILDMDPTRAEALDDARNQLRSLYRAGLGLSLNRIAIETNEDSRTGPATHSRFALWLCDRLKSGDALRIFTLNYDVILDKQITEIAARDGGISVTHQFHNANPKTLPISNSEHPEIKAFKIRDYHDASRSSNNIKAEISHLHGSLQWVRKKSGDYIDNLENIYMISQMSDMLDCNFFTRYAKEDLDWEPVVILTDRKKDEALRQPFSRAYANFVSSLTRANEIIIAGYSFGDDHVNHHLRQQLTDRQEVPEILVITSSNENEEDLREEVLDHLSRRRSSVRSKINSKLTIKRSGLLDAVEDLTQSRWP